MAAEGDPDAQQRPAALEARVARCLMPGSVVLVAVGSGLLVSTARGATNPDMFGYLEMAERLAAGDVWGSVNTYWSPLFAWLLTPLLLVGAEPILAFRMLLAAAAAVAAVPLHAVACRILRSTPARAAALASGSVLLVAWSAKEATPDLLLVPIALMYALAVARLADRPTPWTASLVGLLAGLGYLAKSYFLPFALLHMTMVCMVGAWRTQGDARRGWVRAWACACAGLACVALPWIVAISCKAGHPTISTAGPYNIRLVGPESKGHAVYLGFLPPSDDSSVSAWSDPGALVEHMEPWPGWRRTVGHLAFYVVLPNAIGVAKITARACWPVVVALGALLVAFAVRHWRHAVWPLLPWVLSVLLFMAGYLPLLAHERYLWPAVMVAALCAAVPLDWLVAQGVHRGVVLLAAVAFVLVSAARPIRVLVTDVSVAAVRVGGWDVPALPVGARVASCGGDHRPVEQGWWWSLEACYRRGAQYFGEGGGQPDMTFLDRHGVDYLLVWFPEQRVAIPAHFQRVETTAGLPWVYRRSASPTGDDGVR